MREVHIALPTVCDDEGSRADVLFDEPDKDVVISVVVLALHQEAVVTAALCSAKEPFAFHNPPAVVLSLPDDGFVDFHNLPRSTDERRCDEEILDHAVSDRSVDTSNRLWTE